jgi:AAA domain
MSSHPLDLFVYDPDGHPHAENWLIDGLLTIPSTTILASPPKVGKTVLATTLAVAVATGQPFFGRPTVQGPVLWFASEETHAERRRLMDQIPYPEGPYPFPAMPENGIHSDRALPIYTCYTRITIDNEFFYREINEATISVKPKLIVLDPLINFAGKHNLADDRSARKALEAIRYLATVHQVAVLALHNARNMRHCANSLQLETAANATWLLERNGEDVRIDLRGRGQFANQTLHARSPNVGVYELIRASHPQVRLPDVVDLVLDALEETPMTTRELAAETDQNLGTIRNAVTKLRYQGRIVNVGKKNRQPTYAKFTNFTSTETV